ncbi:CaiB/BaiF CoA-transferase family protein [Novosphingobium resinovorum]|uniref:Formyl-CoA transferase n=1 Tax=Novosphingobium resinovorum TaxID=158500 RepID=A0A031K0G5_9SPHN|nr:MULTISPECIES: CaiB/BaiF CoA-transferase family protein [Sphingomonadaceae]AOR79087.1 formyl-CoA transferase [Novosphingobium resinovorum]EJU10233.1 succinyl-CoA:(R)-citramalate CoA-transferase [Sphingomonas sp. LH128]EZP82710.1 Succinyl-CoA:(R)-citramalate CoA-transferase [Novosphingobium resinovorum]MBF7014644.1 CoA transferase [Novosphingobium sp. HR1a]WJM24875.1 CaiB/BaiF CoA-transferase family protein [Novosphingobium resinovorum]
MDTPNTGALTDIRVVELGQLIAGPFCGQLLGDMGAEVIKVEPPQIDGKGGGDPMRNWGHGDAKLWWEVVARNKKSVSANLRVPQGQEIVRKLVAHADILIENFKPGTMEKWGLGPDVLHEINPRLIIVRVSGYGQTGPYSSRAGFGGIGEAMGGWRYIVGDPDRAPSRMGVSIGDSLAATYGCMGALAALHARERTGKGQVVDSALYEAVLQVMESLVPEYMVSDHVRKRTGSILEGIAPSNVYPTSDGEYLIGANQDAIFKRLCQAMGRPEIGTDERYATHVARGERQTELDDLIAEWTRTLTVDELEEKMIEFSIPAGKIYRAPEMLSDPHFAAREALIDVEHPQWGSFKMQNAFPKLSATPSSVRRRAPLEIGQDNAEIYGDLLGMSEDEIAALKAGAAI